MSRHYFYKAADLATVLSDDQAATVVRTPALILGEREAGVTTEQATLVAVDGHNSALNNRGDRRYGAYGFQVTDSTQPLVGFNGQHRDDVSNCDLLGNGTRSFSPVLMRFCMPDVLSPFEEGGLNAYAYCEGDPINFVDPSGTVKSRSLPNRFNKPNPLSVTQTAPSKARIQRSASTNTGAPRPETSNTAQRSSSPPANTPPPNSSGATTDELLPKDIAKSLFSMDFSEKIGIEARRLRDYREIVRPAPTRNKYTLAHQLIGLAVANTTRPVLFNLRSLGIALLPPQMSSNEYAQNIDSLNRNIRNTIGH